MADISKIKSDQDYKPFRRATVYVNKLHQRSTDIAEGPPANYTPRDPRVGEDGIIINGGSY